MSSGQLPEETILSTASTWLHYIQNNVPLNVMIDTNPKPVQPTSTSGPDARAPANSRTNAQMPMSSFSPPIPGNRDDVGFLSLYYL